MLELPRITVIVPTYNEQADIRRTCEALACLDYPLKEILVVDDASTDHTISIVNEFVSQHHFRLIQQPRNQGVASARNVGIQNAQGDVVVILNADVFPKSDFLQRTAVHYRNGAEYVTVESQVSNIEYFLARYSQAFYELFHGGSHLIGWSEGFSCLRKCALEAGLFPEIFPGASGEDVVFMERLAAKFRNGVVDHAIVVPHVAPVRLQDFWAQFRGRGRGFVYYRHFFGGISLKALILTRAVGTVATLFRIVLLVPMLWFASRLCTLSVKKYRDLVPFCFARAIQLLAHRQGEWQGLAEIVVKNRVRNHK